MIINTNKKLLKIGFVLLILTVGFLSGCINEKTEVRNSKNNAAVKQLELLHKEDMPDNMAMLIVNEPNNAEIDIFQNITKSSLADNGTNILIVPAYNDSTIKILEVAMKENKLVEIKTVLKEMNTKDSYGLLLEVIRPEGIPQYKIVIEYEGGSAEYLISYNGKDGNPHFEYVLGT